MVKIFKFIFLVYAVLVNANDLDNFKKEQPMPGVANDSLGKGDWPVFHGSYLGYSFLHLTVSTKVM